MAVGRGLAHIRHPGMGQPGWGETQRWLMVGADPSVSNYDTPDPSGQSNLSYSVGGNVTTKRIENAPTNPSMNRAARTSTFSSVPAARFFQGYFSTGFSWLSPELNLVGHLAHAPLNMNYNPGQAGTKELHPATVYNPYPPSSDYYPKAL